MDPLRTPYETASARELPRSVIYFGEATMGLRRNEHTPPSTEQSDYMIDTHNVPSRSVTMAVNYELSMIKELERKRRPESVDPSSTSASPPAARPNVENDAPNLPLRDTKMTTQAASNVLNTQRPDRVDSSSSGRHATIETPSRDMARRSGREKRETSMTKLRVRYDMQLVPPARRHRAFLDCFPLWWLSTSSKETTTRKSARRAPRRHDENLPPCDRCDGPVLAPFSEDTSVVWVPKNRAEWEDTVSEMTAVCTSAAIRRYHAEKSDKPFYPPLSADYIRDRVDIDDPLLGYQLRHKSGGWLQGFVLFTNFTVWTRNFHWDSKHEISGMKVTDSHTDSDGSLAKELEEQERVGDPLGEGIVFPSIAEISLVGGLGCGEYMLRMAMEDIRATGTYKYVILQSTELSKAFYERFGFVRVGAICQYEVPNTDGTLPPVMGYRHWTHANESEKSLELHGGPSYMMCLKLPDADEMVDSCYLCGRLIAESNNPDFMKALVTVQVDEKPTVEQLGATFTPAPKQRRNSDVNAADANGLLPVKRGRGRPKGSKNAKSSLKPAKSAKRKYDAKPENAKRKKLDGADEFDTSKQLLTPPRSGPRRSSTPKQYPPVWSAVGPDSGRQPGRRGAAAAQARMSLDAKDKPFYSVRGVDGRFVTVPNILPPQQNPETVRPRKPKSKPRAKSAPKSRLTTASSSRQNNGFTRSIGFGRADGKPTPIERHDLLKQKVVSYPRDRCHYYNRIVKPIRGPKKYYYVMHFDETNRRMRIAPVEARGRLTGQREGRPRFQVILQDTDANFLTVNADDYVIVPSTNIMKTPVVANEAFDIED